MDIGDCPKIHDLALRADFEAASKARDYYYDIDVSPNLTLLIFFNLYSEVYLIKDLNSPTSLITLHIAYSLPSNVSSQKFIIYKTIG